MRFDPFGSDFHPAQLDTRQRHGSSPGHSNAPISPNSIENVQLKTTQALELVSRDHHALLSAETKSWMSEHSKDTSASLDKLRDQVGRELNVHREAWAGALSLHRQEMSVMFSAVLAGIKTVSGCSTATASGQTLIAVDNNTLAKTGQARGSGTSPTAPEPTAQNTHTLDITHEEPHGPSSSSASSLRGLARTRNHKPNTQPRTQALRLGISHLVQYTVKIAHSPEVVCSSRTLSRLRFLLFQTKICPNKRV
ncbi:hypothetical protein B0J17DRAFT_266644 [Rhizoctonia solani]|nr:hypothetical protein B0J17DRAFT_266644 [Rhizoctonia solani]